MIKDTITHGETYTINASASDAAGATLVMDGTWQVACRVTEKIIGGTIVLNEVAMTIAAGVASHVIDTGESPWAPGIYVYDVRVTDPDGQDFWSEPVQLKLLNRNTPASS